MIVLLTLELISAYLAYLLVKRHQGLPFMRSNRFRRFSRILRSTRLFIIAPISCLIMGSLSKTSQLPLHGINTILFYLPGTQMRAMKMQHSKVFSETRLED